MKLLISTLSFSLNLITAVEGSLKGGDQAWRLGFLAALSPGVNPAGYNP